jgi:acyl-CoA synthetase (AMP-forming)/AMP-acid ligase II
VVCASTTSHPGDIFGVIATSELLHELVSDAADVEPDRPAVIGEDGAVTTFRRFDARIREVAGWIADRCAPGDRVAVVADNSPDYAVAYYAAPRAGCILTTVNQRLTPTEQALHLALCRPTVLLGDRRHLDALRRIGGPPIAHTVAFDDPGWAAVRGDAPSRGVSPGDPAWLLFTSGSTGTPKAVLHSHRSISAAVRGGVSGRAVRPGGVYLLPFPMCHVAGHNMMVQHAVRSAVLPVAAFRPGQFVDLVHRHGVTSCSLAPTMLHTLLAHLEDSGAALPTLRDIAYGSAAIPADLLRRALDRLDVGFHQGYGMTETGGNVTFLGPAEHRAGAAGAPGVLASAGVPHAGVELAIDGADGVGEILVRGPQVAISAWPDGALTDSDGWLHTGDVGRIDAAGRLVVLDRVKDIIVTGGENVSAREIEDVLSGHPGVDMVAVVAVPDDHWGEAVCAVVVATRGTAPTEDALIAHVRRHVAAFKRPRRVVFVEALPLTTNGKIDKVAVRRLVRDLA